MKTLKLFLRWLRYDAPSVFFTFAVAAYFGIVATALAYLIPRVWDALFDSPEAQVGLCVAVFAVLVGLHRLDILWLRFKQRHRDKE